MLHTAVIEAQVEDTLRLIEAQKQGESFDVLVGQTRTWADDGGVRMTDDELRGALTALQLMVRRAGLWGLPANFLQFAGEIAATLTVINRTRQLNADEEAAILRTLEALANGDNAKIADDEDDQP
jgi:hypothetical protein